VQHTPVARTGTNLWLKAEGPTHVNQLTKDQKEALAGKMFADELLQTSVVFSIIFTTVFAVRMPQYYWVLHSVKALIYLPWRYRRFAKDNCELYLLDFCYFWSYYTVLLCSLAVLRTTLGVHSGLHHFNHELFCIAFFFANGALGMSIIMFKNSLVFYNIDQVTSLFIHISPGIVCWCFRWGGGLGLLHNESYVPGLVDVCRGMDLTEADKCLSWPGITQWCRACPLEVANWTWRPMLCYFLLWAVPYYLIHFVWLKSWIETNQKENLYTLVMSNPGQSRFIRKLPETLQPAGYMLQHTSTMICFGALAPLMWHNFLLHTTYICSLLLIAIHNGTTYTFRVFGMKYADTMLDTHKRSILVEASVAKGAVEMVAGTRAEDPLNGHEV